MRYSRVTSTTRFYEKRVEDSQAILLLANPLDLGANPRNKSDFQVIISQSNSCGLRRQHHTNLKQNKIRHQKYYTGFLLSKRNCKKRKNRHQDEIKNPV
jgi:uncharacterized protein YbbK (DUF523 family)